MDIQSLIANIDKALKSSKTSLAAAESWMQEVKQELGVMDESPSYSANTSSEASFEIVGDEKVLEGVFNGKSMIADDGTEYPVPANYASKSKLVEHDRLKLTVKPNGSFIYKQIELIPRKIVKGRLIIEDGQYKVLTEDNAYNILYASVTFFKIQVGDEVSVLIPEGMDATWGAVENIIPASAVF